jgi:hypothetical protein
MFYKLPPWQRHILDYQAEFCFIIITLNLMVFSMRRWRVFVMRAIALETSVPSGCRPKGKSYALPDYPTLGDFDLRGTGITELTSSRSTDFSI